MKPGDFFIGVRQFLGIVIPGFIWIIAASLGVGKYDPIENLDQHSWREIVAVLFCAYLLGLALRGLSLRFGVVVGKWLYRFGTFTRVLKAPSQSAILVNIVPVSTDDPLRKLAHSQITSMMADAGIPLDMAEKLSEPDLDEICQQYILGPEQLARRVEQAQAEVELYATSLLPLLLLIAALQRYWAGGAAKGTFFGMHDTAWCAGLIILFFLLALKLHFRRIAEQMDWYRMLITLSIVKKTAETTPGVTSEIAKEPKGCTLM